MVRSIDAMRSEFEDAVTAYQAAFGLDLPAEIISRLADYFELVMEHNSLLHLVAPCPPQEFATRHILESMSMLSWLPRDAEFVDIGSGGGLPALPCLIARPDLRGRLIESRQKKAGFLELAISGLDLANRASVTAKQFTETDPGEAGFVTCRALDKFPERLGRLVKWSRGRSLLFFGGEQIGQLLAEMGEEAPHVLLPLSERRYLFAGIRNDR